MLRKWTFVAALVLIALLAFSANVAAQEEPVANGESPFFAMPISQEWTDLSVGEYHWYAFTYDFDDRYDRLEVRVTADPPESAVVTIRNKDQARLWEQDGTHVHVGCCTKVDIDNKVYDDEDEDFDADKDYGDKTVTAPYMSWAADDLASGEYYIVVNAAEGFDNEISYRLEVLGQGVFSEPAVVEVTAEPVTALKTAATMMEAPVAMAAHAGERPFFAMPISQEWNNLSADQQHWYAFTYDFDENYGPLEVIVHADPAKSAIVTIRNEDQARLWAQDGTQEHVGCCTELEIDNKVYDDEDEDFDEDKDYGDQRVKAPYMHWAADELASGKYYIVVSRAAGFTGDIAYRLEVMGEGVFSEQATVEPAAESVAVLPAAAPAMELAAQAVRAGESPALALPITTEWVSVAAGEPDWYAFTYDDDDTYGPLELRVYADPEQSAVVTVRNQAQAELWVQDGAEEHFGCCTPADIANKVFDDEGDDFDEDKDYGDRTVQAPYMRWAADDLASGQYYIVVALAEGAEGPAMYRLEVFGEGVDS
jgi:hypothetical protein